MNKLWKNKTLSRTQARQKGTSQVKHSKKKKFVFENVKWHGQIHHFFNVFAWGSICIEGMEGISDWKKHQKKRYC